MSTGTKNRWRSRAHEKEPWLILITMLILILVIPVQAELVPDFTGTPRSGVTPLTVRFNDTSTGPHDHWEWDFGDGNTATEQKPSNTYNEPGFYTVTLIVSNASEDQATIVQDNYITVEPAVIPEPLIPDFTGTPRSGVTPLTVRFNDTSTGPHDHWEWDFGDGNTSTEQKPSYTYNEPGSYTVTLIVSNAGEDQATIVQDNYITVEPAVIPEPLIPDFTGTPRSGVTPLTVRFNDTSTGPHDHWEWDFGEGNTSTEQKPSYTYNEPGSYTVTLIVSNAGEDQATIVQDNYITVEPAVIPEPLIPDFNGTPRSDVTPLTVRFNDTSTGPHDHWEWDFGDGNTSTEQKPSNTYNEPGSYTVTLIVSNAGEDHATIVQDNYITVNPAPSTGELILDFNGSPRSGVSPLNVQFNDASTVFAEPVTYLWDFGDGNTSTEQNPLYTYNQPGSYMVTLNVSPSEGAPASIAKNKYISVEPPPNPILLDVNFTGTPRSGVTPLTVRFNDTSTGPHDNWEWEFGDGNTSTEQKPSHTYNDPGSYTVKLIVSNAGEDEATIVQDNYITVNPAPSAGELILDFNGTPRSGTSPLNVQFNDASTGFVEPVTYLWDFGDGNTSTEQNPLYTYNQPGSYKVTLNVSPSEGAPALIAKNNFIAVTSIPLLLPVIDFVSLPTSGDVPLTVIFSDLSTNYPITWNWSFGDDSLENATEQNPVHTYTNPGTYTVSLNASNTNGSASHSREGYIRVRSAAVPHVLPSAEFFGIPTSGIAPLAVSFTDLSTNTTSWNWSFGDDSSENATEQNPIHTYTDPGTYTVLLIASNADGSDSQTREEYITVNQGTILAPPVADFYGDTTSGDAPLTVVFTDLSTNTTTSWLWSFGDDNAENATEQNPIHTYTNPGTYTVSLNASNAEGSDTRIRTDYITVSAIPVVPQIPEPLIPDFTGTPASGPAPLTVQFNDTSTGEHDQWGWEFGDGNTSSEQNPLYTYNQPGSYSVLLNVSQAGGDSGSTTKEDYITVVIPLIPVPLNATPPIPKFTGEPTSGVAPLTVQFNDTSTGEHDQWGWEFGDGNTSSEQNPLYTYYEPGSYSVTLNTSQAGGDSVSITQEDYITVLTVPLEPPVADFSCEPTSGVAPLTVTFTDLSTNTPTSWNWSFGDGNSSTEQNISYTYTSEGIYSVTLNITNLEGSNTTTKTNYITVSLPDAGPVADFSATPTSGLTPLTVQFTDSSTGFTEPITYFWDFGDGSNSTERNPSHTYSSENSQNYTVSFNVSGNYGKAGSIIKSDYISLLIPTIELTLSEIPPDQSYLPNESIPQIPSLPQSQSIPRNEPELQSFPQSRSAVQAVSYTQSSPLQAQSYPQDTTPQTDLPAASWIWVNPGQAQWTLNSGANTKNNAFYMIITSTSDWWVNVKDAENGKPTGKFAEYNYNTHEYVDNGKFLKDPLYIQCGQGTIWPFFGVGQPSGPKPAVEVTGGPEDIQWGGPVLPIEYFPINLNQYIEPSDSGLGSNRGYRIVITFEASNSAF